MHPADRIHGPLTGPVDNTVNLRRECANVAKKKTVVVQVGQSDSCTAFPVI
jgi:hypothetical protein